MRRTEALLLITLASCTPDDARPTVVEPTDTDITEQADSESNQDADEPTDTDEPTDATQDDSDSGDDVGQAMGSMFAPRWVLRDRDGELVDAIVRPGFDPKDVRSGIDEVISDLRCFGVEAVGPNPVRGTYELATGELGPCLAPPTPFYLDGSCTEVLIFSRAGVVLDRNENPVVAGERLENVGYFQLLPDGTCNSTGAAMIDGWRAVPAPIAWKHAFPNPPYTLEANY